MAVVIYDGSCAVCGKPATNAAFDIWRRDNPNTGAREYQHTGNTTYGCKEHPAGYKEYDLGMSLFGDGTVPFPKEVRRINNKPPKGMEK